MIEILTPKPQGPSLADVIEEAIEPYAATIDWDESTTRDLTNDILDAMGRAGYIVLSAGYEGEA